MQLVGAKELFGDTDGFSIWENEEFAAVANGPGDYGFVILDLRDKFRPNIYSHLFAAGSLEEVFVTKDKQYVYAALKYYGLIVYNINNLLNPSI